MSKNLTMSLFDDGPEEVIFLPSPPIPAHPILNQDNIGCSKISTKGATEVALPTKGKIKEQRNESIAFHAEASSSLELLPLTTTEKCEKEADKRGLAHWQTAAETLSQIAFRLASTTSAR